VLNSTSKLRVPFYLIAHVYSNFVKKQHKMKSIEKDEILHSSKIFLFKSTCLKRKTR